jgi:hypothetical protein
MISLEPLSQDWVLGNLALPYSQLQFLALYQIMQQKYLLKYTCNLNMMVVLSWESLSGQRLMDNNSNNPSLFINTRLQQPMLIIQHGSHLIVLIEIYMDQLLIINLICLVELLSIL